MSRTKWSIALAAGAVLVASLFVSCMFTATATHAAPSNFVAPPCRIVPDQTGYVDTAKGSPIITLQNALYAAYDHGAFVSTPSYPFAARSFHPADGIYGTGTINAVIDLQTQLLGENEADASVGTKTWKSLSNFSTLNCQP